MNTYSVVFLQKNGEYTGGLRIVNDGESGITYFPAYWRADLYLQGLTKLKNQIRPDIYEQELLDLFDGIYDFKNKKFKSDLIKNPNDLKYFFDYLELVNRIYDCSIDVLNIKIYSYKQDKMNRLFNVEIPDIIIIDLGMDEYSRKKIINKCEFECSLIQMKILKFILIFCWNY